MKIARRHLLALGAATAAVSVMGAGAGVASWWRQPADAPFSVLSADEAQFVRAWSGAAFPGGATLATDGATANLDRFFDGVLAHVPDTQQHLLRLLLHALDNGAIVWSGSRFTSLSSNDARTVFHTLLAHDIAEVRGAAQSLTVLLGMGYSTHPDVAPVMARWHRCGYG